MSVLKENRSYGLSSGSWSSWSRGKNNNNVSVFHVKLTDSAARAVYSFNNTGKGSSHPTIRFTGNDGRISIPCSDTNQLTRVFTFSLTDVARDNPHGCFDCVQQLVPGVEQLSCLGGIQKKMTVNATDDSYDKARQSMAQAEGETRSRGAIVIKHGGRFQGKKVRVRAPAAALASLTKPKVKGVVTSKLRRGASMGDVQGRPLKDRVAHLLALRPYTRPELILRLQKDGLSDGLRDTLDSVLAQVGQLNVREKAFILKDSLYKELQKDWPGYTTGDTQLLKRILVRRLFQPQSSLLMVPKAQVSPLRDTPNSSPAHRPRGAVPDEYTDPLLTKKPRISHLFNKASQNHCRLRSHATPSDNTTQRNVLDPRALSDSLAAVCQPDAEAAQRLAAPSEAAQRREPGPQSCERSPSPLVVPDLKKHALKRKKSKHKKERAHEKDRWREREEERTEKDAGSEITEHFLDSELQVEVDQHDFVSKYSTICSLDQRQKYKQDFNHEYNEYRDLHARIDRVTHQFMDLDTQLKRLHRDSHKYKSVRNQILQEYRKIKKSNPNYNQDKIRCEHLHNKLAHIKKIISEFDLQQLQTQRSSST
ncbi:RNA polymerase II elongation factor ELL-like isoform X2 [Gouania willdenowi]|uniref:RNA polymerase II elongation factor ELL-like n=1 Tax=Gouania willdenowi TaxID=441366 RepID=A0A8C5I515_GOUWI|nr:RNA polymerase II elongation factor ELL-like isoform X2 [Gouania willdenowi]